MTDDSPARTALQPARCGQSVSECLEHEITLEAAETHKKSEKTYGNLDFGFAAPTVRGSYPSDYPSRVSAGLRAHFT